MRLRNVKGSKEIIDSSEYIIKDYKNYKGNYNKLFKNNNPIHIEIGMGKGNFIINMAKKYPNINFIGIEKYDSVIARSVQKIDDFIPNLKLIRMDATEIDEVFDKEIDVIYLNFSDPWPKNRHEHRRLTCERFLKRYDKLFKNKKNIIMKTDNRKLFEFSIISFIDHDYKIKNISLNLYEDDLTDNVKTEYEEKFSSMGYPIYKIEVES